MGGAADAAPLCHVLFAKSTGDSGPLSVCGWCAFDPVASRVSLRLCECGMSGKTIGWVSN